MAKTRGRHSALFQAVFEFIFDKAGGDSSASSALGSVSIGISPWVRFHAVHVTWVAEVSVPLFSVRAFVAIFVDIEVCALLENFFRVQCIPGIMALRAAVFLAVR